MAELSGELRFPDPTQSCKPHLFYASVCRTARTKGSQPGSQRRELRLPAWWVSRSAYDRWQRRWWGAIMPEKSQFRRGTPHIPRRDDMNSMEKSSG